MIPKSNFVRASVILALVALVGVAVSVISAIGGGENRRCIFLPNASCPGVQLAGRDLSEIDMRGANLSRANLSGATLTRANLNDANLAGANLSGANLSGATLARARLTGATLTDAKLAGAALVGAVWTDGRICAQDSIGACR